MILLFGFTAFYGLRAIRIAHQNAIDGLGYHAVSLAGIGSGLII
jgi:hypothetical protein